MSKERASGHGLADELRTMLSDQGKQQGGAAGPSRMREGLETSWGSSSSRPSAFRTTGATDAEADADYQAFERGARMDTDMMERAWQQSVPMAPAMAGARTAPDTQRDAAHFLAALEQEVPMANEAATPAPATPPVVTLEDEWRPPSPSQGFVMTREQYALHEQLARDQAGIGDGQPYRLAERLEPPADDATLEEGVYARDPTAALETVWHAQDRRAARVQEVQAARVGSIRTSPYTQVRGQEIIDRLRGWLVRQGYTDEVYGLPPLTAQTFGEAVMEANDAAAEERRAVAIRRLDALYRHLSTSAPEGGASAMEAWLQANPK